jgi:hypothetical protein
MIISTALEKAIANASKSRDARKHNLLQLSAKGLRDAAALVKDVAPGIISTADLIASLTLAESEDPHTRGQS